MSRSSLEHTPQGFERPAPQWHRCPLPFAVSLVSDFLPAFGAEPAVEMPFDRGSMLERGVRDVWFFLMSVHTYLSGFGTRLEHLWPFLASCGQTAGQVLVRDLREPARRGA
jgi:hypothetical protein